MCEECEKMRLRATCWCANASPLSIPMGKPWRSIQWAANLELDRNINVKKTWLEKVVRLKKLKRIHVQASVSYIWQDCKTQLLISLNCGKCMLRVTVYTKVKILRWISVLQPGEIAGEWSEDSRMTEDEVKRQKSFIQYFSGWRNGS